MNEEQWRRERDDRTLRYAERRLDPGRFIAITARRDHVCRYDGQVALITLCNLLSRMTPSIGLAFPDQPVHPSLPWWNHSLHDLILAQMRAADPYGRFKARKACVSDHRIHCGPGGLDGADVYVHGAGWNAYVGPAPSTLPAARDGNPAGAALAAIFAGAQIFVNDFEPVPGPVVANSLDWKSGTAPGDPAIPDGDLGSIFTVGVGSVGTAALYFLTLANRRFQPTLIDMDPVRRHNLDRSPIFADSDVGEAKVDVARLFLAGAGFRNIRTATCALHETDTWMARPAGNPDIVIASANEKKVRYHIESQFPPVQIYGTTGRNWQASLVRHIPLVDACSCCLFPEEAPAARMACATAPPEAGATASEQVDAALPFLSFAAGLMAATEILKIKMPGYPFTRNNVSMMTRPAPRFVSLEVPHRPGCLCGQRSEKIHRTMLEGSRHADLSAAVHRADI
jgi:hypothetical protein